MDEKTILVIEDEPTINRILSKYFKKAGFNVLSALNGAIGLELFSRHEIDLVCLDIMMPRIDGWEVAKRIRAVSNVPVILMSALSDEEDILKGFKLQVDDYITKPFTPAVLVAKIKSLFNRIEIEHGIEGVYEINGINIELSSFKENATLEELLSKDELTGVANRRFLDFHLQNYIKRAKEFHVGFGVLFLDLDYFKKVNDTYGHLVGDIVLKETAGIIEKNLRNSDLVGRYGGEEFIAILQVDNTRHLRLIAEKLRKAIEDHVFNEEDKKIKLTVSIGGTLFGENDDEKSVVERADKNMYSSKQNGRNRVTLK